MWPFKKPGPMDDAGTIYATEDGSQFYPLEPENNEQYLKDLDKIKDILRMWITQDVAFAGQKGIKIENTLVYQLMNIDLKFLPYPANLIVLERCMKDPGGSLSGSRLMDAFNRIYLYVSLDTIRVITGRFLYGMVYGLGASINNNQLPDKNTWLGLLRTTPWIPFLTFIQELYDEDDAVSKMVALHGSKYASDTTQVTAGRSMGHAPIPTSTNASA